MDASIVGCISNLEITYRCVEHEGKKISSMMSINQFSKLLYAVLKKGHQSLSEISTDDIEDILKQKDISQNNLIME